MTSDVDHRSVKWSESAMGEADYLRDLIGYGRETPDPQWPAGARVALQFVINYEEGAERNVLHGDEGTEVALTEEPTTAYAGRNLNVESQYEYGSRSGFWRLHRLFQERNLPVTVFGTSMALARNPAAVAAMREAGWEIASHGYRWMSYHDVPLEIEQQHFRAALEIHTRVTGERPLGWYLGRPSLMSRRLVTDEGGFLYDSDYFGDDLPFWTYESEHPHLVIPYTLDNNDVRFVTPYGFGSSDFSDYLSGALDLLWREGATHPKMMSVGLHCRLVGRPGRAAMLERFLDRVANKDGLWVTRRVDIARHWRAVLPPSTAARPAEAQRS